MSTEETIFHKIIRKELPADVVYEDEEVLAFKDINPVSPTHILVIPKKTMPSLREAESADKELLGHMLLVIKQIADEEGLAEKGYRVVINTGQEGGQLVDQLHLHLLGGRAHGWPPG